MYREWGDLYIIFHQVHDACLHGIFGSLVRIVYTQFPEDILSVAVYRMEAEVSFRRLFSLVVFPRAISFRMLRSAVVSKSSLMAGWVGEEEPLPASSRLLT